LFWESNTSYILTTTILAILFCTPSACFMSKKIILVARLAKGSRPVQTRTNTSRENAKQGFSYINAVYSLLHNSLNTRSHPIIRAGGTHLLDEPPPQLAVLNNCVSCGSPSTIILVTILEAAWLPCSFGNAYGVHQHQFQRENTLSRSYYYNTLSGCIMAIG
jgi:hypothetical protein